MMQGMLTVGRGDATQALMRVPVLFLVLIGTAGCVQVNAPDRPIEINLNVNIKQEVLVRLQRDAQELIEQNSELFPQ